VKPTLEECEYRTRSESFRYEFEYPVDFVYVSIFARIESKGAFVVFTERKRPNMSLKKIVS